MTDLSPDIQAKLRAQAEALWTEHYAAKGRVMVAAIADALLDAYALGVSTERARQQGLIQKWREEADGVEAQGYSQQADRVRWCADELEGQ